MPAALPGQCAASSALSISGGVPLSSLTVRRDRALSLLRAKSPQLWATLAQLTTAAQTQGEEADRRLVLATILLPRAGRSEAARSVAILGQALRTIPSTDATLPLRLVDQLHRATQTLSHASPEQSRLKSELLIQVGLAYGQLGQTDRARKVFNALPDSMKAIANRADRIDLLLDIAEAMTIAVGPGPGEPVLESARRLLEAEPKTNLSLWQRSLSRMVPLYAQLDRRDGQVQWERVLALGTQLPKAQNESVQRAIVLALIEAQALSNSSQDSILSAKIRQALLALPNSKLRAQTLLDAAYSLGNRPKSAPPISPDVAKRLGRDAALSLQNGTSMDLVQADASQWFGGYVGRGTPEILSFMETLDLYGYADYWVALGRSARKARRWAIAETALAAIQDPAQRAISEAQLAAEYALDKQPAKAKAAFDRAIKRGQALTGVQPQIVTLTKIASQLAIAGQSQRAEQTFQDSLLVLQRMRMPQATLVALNGAIFKALTGDPRGGEFAARMLVNRDRSMISRDEGRAILDRTLEVGNRAGVIALLPIAQLKPDEAALVWLQLAQMTQDQGDDRRAIGFVTEVLKSANQQPNPLSSMRLEQAIAAYLQLGAIDRAEALAAKIEAPRRQQFQALIHCLR
jgi:hypothetical protein